MESIYRHSHRLISIPLAGKSIKPHPNRPFRQSPIIRFHQTRELAFKPGPSSLKPVPGVGLITRRSESSSLTAKAGWFLGLGEKKEVLPEILKAGDPVLHEPAREVPIEEIGSDRIQKIIDDMVEVMRKAPGVGLAAPQIGIPLKIIVLEDTKEYISYAPKEETKAQDRRPFDLLVIVNPKLRKKSNKIALFFEGCLSVDGFRAVVERNLEVEVTGLDRNGQPIKVDASGWQARILQHECDHLDGTLYVDKMVQYINLVPPLPKTNMASTACFMIVSRNDIPIYEAEVGAVIKHAIHTRLMLFHDSSNDDGIKSFFQEVHELYIKVLLNPLYLPGAGITSSHLNTKVRALAGKYP